MICCFSCYGLLYFALLNLLYLFWIPFPEALPGRPFGNEMAVAVGIRQVVVANRGLPVVQAADVVGNLVAYTILTGRTNLCSGRKCQANVDRVGEADATAVKVVDE